MQARFRTLRSRDALSLWLVGWLLVSCGGGDVGVQKTNMDGFWVIDAVNGNRQQDTQLETGNYGAGAEPYQAGASASHDFGPLIIHPPDKGPNAKAEVFVSESGETYWVSAESTAVGATGTGDPIGSRTTLGHIQYYRKTSENATLQYVITDTLLEAIDDSAQEITPQQCPWIPDTLDNECEKVMVGAVNFTLAVNHELPSPEQDDQFYLANGRASLQGFRGRWRGQINTYSDSYIPLWNLDDFERDFVDGDLGWYKVRLAAPITIDVPLDSLPVGATFYAVSFVQAWAYQTRNVEAYMGAYFRDPVNSDGLNVSYSGLEPIEPLTSEIPEPAAPEPAPACETPDPAAGVIEFESASFKEPELPGFGAEVIVTRTGGSRGEVSARFTTSDDTALAGVDYEAVDTFVLFADGEEGSRVVDVPLVINQTAEADKTLDLTLSEPGGCASLGEQSTATLTIMDDDRDLPADTGYTLGGTVTGLEGSGLVLVNLSDEVSPTDDGPFTFPRGYGSGVIYNVRVKTQPSNPVQTCTVANGEGTITDADVTNIEVTCAEPAPAEEGLDPTFGTGGKVTEGLEDLRDGGASDMALQSDGKIVVVGGGATLARYNVDGSLDSSFGTGGVVDVVFLGNTYDKVSGVALQSDGKIVVVGEAQVGVNDARSYDWAVARYNADGSVDNSFGPNGDGKHVLDFGPAAYGSSIDFASDVAIQPDGKIIVAGNVLANQTGVAERDFTVMRFTASGAVDSGFGVGGVAKANVVGLGDLLYAVALQSDGKIVATGRVAKDGGDDPDVGLARFNADGSPDTSFGPNGDGTLRDETDHWDEAADLAVQPDGKIVVVGFDNPIGVDGNFLLARYDASGNPDPGFGSGGRVSDLFPSSSCVSCIDYAAAFAVALQDDGKVVAAGLKNTEGIGDFAVGRLNADGTTDASFGTDGKLTVDFFGGGDSARAVLVQPDGKIVVGGTAKNGSQTGLGLIRVFP